MAQRRINAIVPPSLSVEIRFQGLWLVQSVWRKFRRQGKMIRGERLETSEPTRGWARVDAAVVALIPSTAVDILSKSEASGSPDRNCLFLGAR
jgi:hypothetical protein